jgi:hypothetical protein
VLAFEIVRFAVPGRYLLEFTYTGATHDVDASLARGWVDELVDANALTQRARAAAQEMARRHPARTGGLQTTGVGATTAKSAFRRYLRAPKGGSDWMRLVNVAIVSCRHARIRWRSKLGNAHAPAAARHDTPVVQFEPPTQ